MVQPWNKDELFQPKQTLIVLDEGPGYCLSCGNEFEVEYKFPPKDCPGCGSSMIEY